MTDTTGTNITRTKVGIVGGGPSGLLLSQLLDLKGIDNIVLEKHSRDYVLGRIRAGVLEHGFAELMREAGMRCADGYRRRDPRRLLHQRWRHPPPDRPCQAFGRQVGDGLRPDRADARPVRRARTNERQCHSRSADVALHDIDGKTPAITYRQGDETIRVRLRLHRRLRRLPRREPPVVPRDALRDYEKVYPFGWLGVLSRTTPVSPGTDLLQAPSAASRCARCARQAQPLLRAGAADGQGRGLVGRGLLGRADARLPDAVAVEAGDRAVDREEHRAAAQLRGRADALRPPVPGRRRRPYRAADRGARAELGRLRHLLSVPRDDRSLPQGRFGRARKATPKRHSPASGRRSASPGG